MRIQSSIHRCTESHYSVSMPDSLSRVFGLPPAESLRIFRTQTCPASLAYNEYHLSYLSRKTIGDIANRFGLEEAGFARLPRMKSLGFSFQYLMDFMLGNERFRSPDWLYKLVIPINLYDNMYVAFRKRA